MIAGPHANITSRVRAAEAAFAAESLFCEWAYVIDLDKGTFEAFEGFQKEPPPPSDRFADLPREAGEEYYPIRMVGSWSLDELPTDEDFVKALEKEDAAE